jgi:signal transduction histidine kinase
MVSPGSGEVPAQSRPPLDALLDLASGRESLSRVARHAAGMLGADAGAVARFLGDERAVIVGVWRESGTPGMPVNAELDFDRSNSALGRARSSGLPARADSYEGLRGELPLVMEAIGLRGSVAAPIMLGERAWGALVVSTRREEPLPADAEERLGELAGLVAQAVADAERRRALEASRLRLVEAADEARRRLERELHEGPHQHLLALVLTLRVARAKAADGSAVAALLDDAIAGAMDADSSLRDLARAIYPVALTERGLAAAVQALAVRAAVQVNLQRLPSRRFPAVVEATAYFAVADALQSAAGEIDVVVADEGDRLRVELCDAGGAAAAAVNSIADRIAAAGGTLDVETQPSGGTVVRALIPADRALSS